MRSTATTFISAALLLASMADLNYAAPMSSLVARTDLWQPITACKNPGDFMLTFHDGPSVNTVDIIKKLKQFNVPATLFLNGNFEDNCIYKYATLIQEAFSAGCDIGSHTWSHAHLTYLKGDNITIMNQELDLLDSALHRILGFKPKLFSPPYGERPSDEALEVIVEDQDMKLVTFVVDTKDKVKDSSTFALEQLKKFITDNPASTSSGIALMRDLRKANVEEVIGQAITMLQEGGYKLVNATTCLGLEKRRGLYKGYRENAALPDISQKDWPTTDKKCYEI